MMRVFGVGFGLGLLTSIFVFGTGCSSSAAKEGTEEAPINAPPRPGSENPETPGNGGADDQAPATPGGSGPSTSCPADLGAAKQISDATDAEDLQIVEGKVFFRRAKALHRVNLDGQGAAQVAAGNQTVSTRYFVNDESILEVNGSMRGGSVVKTFIDDAGEMVGQWSRGWGGGSGGGTTTPPEAINVVQNLRVFGADASQYYATDGSKDGTSEVVIFAMSNVTWRRVKKIMAPLTDPQSLGTAMFFVASAKDIMKLDTTTGADAAVFASEPGCRLALGKTEALCSATTGLVAFDLATAAKRSILEAAKSKSAAPFGLAVSDAATGIVFVSSSAAAPDATKHVLREVKSADGAERLLACGREGAITSVAFDAKTVVFAEANKGIFAVAR
jgi:hypothetical protein